jgi:hypothetical protein
MAEQRSDQPTHWLTQIHVYDGGLTERFVMDSHYLPAAEAQQSRILRLRENNIAYDSGPGWVTYREDRPHMHPELRCSVRLEWADHKPED